MYIRSVEARENPSSHPRIPISSGLGEEVGRDSTASMHLGDVESSITAAERQMQAHLDRYNRYVANPTRRNNGVAARAEVAKYWEWSRERDFLESLKAVYESQAGVPLNFRRFPVSRPNKNAPWRQVATRQSFKEVEASGSFCLGSARAMTFRTLFGLDRPTNRRVLTDLKGGIEAAKAAGDTEAEAKLLISRIVSHKHDPGSMMQFNSDVAARYDVKDVVVRSGSRTEALSALKAGAPVLADLKGGWHWVMVQKSPRGVLWANDPLSGGGTKRISPGELGSRFELIVNAQTGAPITPKTADGHKRP